MNLDHDGTFCGCWSHNTLPNARAHNCPRFLRINRGITGVTLTYARVVLSMQGWSQQLLPNNQLAGSLPLSPGVKHLVAAKWLGAAKITHPASHILHTSCILASLLSCGDRDGVAFFLLSVANMVQQHKGAQWRGCNTCISRGPIWSGQHLSQTNKLREMATCTPLDESPSALGAPLPAVPGARECIFIRHGATSCMDASFRLVRQARDDPLSDVGREQARSLQPLAAALAASLPEPSPKTPTPLSGVLFYSGPLS